jgi:hypothetical protein
MNNIIPYKRIREQQNPLKNTVAAERFGSSMVMDILKFRIKKKREEEEPPEHGDGR